MGMAFFMVDSAPVLVVASEGGATAVVVVDAMVDEFRCP